MRILSTDISFSDSPDAGLPACLCSRCKAQILQHEIPIRIYSSNPSREFRYHPSCIGLPQPASPEDGKWQYEADLDEDISGLNGDSDTDAEWEDYGPCCICELITPSVNNFICLDRRAPIPGTGWGCLVCDLPADGALAVVCDDCLKLFSNQEVQLKNIVWGYPAEKQRMPYTNLSPKNFKHDPAFHPEDQPQKSNR